MKRAGRVSRLSGSRRRLLERLARRGARPSEPAGWNVEDDLPPLSMDKSRPLIPVEVAR